MLSDIATLPAVAAPSSTLSPSMTSAAPTTAAAGNSPHASPVSLLDASTGLVVLEFFDAKGNETASLPTKKQLELYRLNELSPNIFEPAIRDASAPATAELPSSV